MFSEAQNFFDFPLGKARPFYSRRIGYYQGQESPILGGGRFLGKMGGSTLGVMVLQTESTDTAKEVGFLSRTGYQLYNARWRINPRPGFLPWIQKLQFKPLDLNDYVDDRTQALQSVYMEFRPLAVFFKSGEMLEINIMRDAENLTEEFEIRNGRVIPAGRSFSGSDTTGENSTRDQAPSGTRNWPGNRTDFTAWP